MKLEVNGLTLQVILEEQNVHKLLSQAMKKIDRGRVEILSLSSLGCQKVAKIVESAELARSSI